MEHVLLATELIHGYNRKTISKRAMLRIDMKKAFESVNWDFVILTMHAMNFSASFIGLVKQCISTTSFSVAINGKLITWVFQRNKGFKTKRSFVSLPFRHGDGTTPLGLSGFIHSTWYFTLSFHWWHHGFSYGTLASLTAIKDTMTTFALWSGLTMNCSKTELFHAGQNQQ